MVSEGDCMVLDGACRVLVVGVALQGAKRGLEGVVRVGACRVLREDVRVFGRPAGC